MGERRGRAQSAVDRAHDRGGRRCARPGSTRAVAHGGQPSSLPEPKSEAGCRRLARCPTVTMRTRRRDDGAAPTGRTRRRPDQAQAERARLAEERAGTAHWRRWGAYLSLRQWGTVREDYSADGDAWGCFPFDHARSRAYRWGEDGLARHLRPPAAPVLRGGAVERSGPDPEGAAVRPHQRRGQPRRGRQGVLVVPRRHADAPWMRVALPLPAARVPLRAAARGEPPPRPATSPSSSCSTPACSTRTGSSTSLVDLRQGGPGRHLHPHHGDQPRPGRRAAARAAARCGSATPGPGGATRASAPTAAGSTAGPHGVAVEHLQLPGFNLDGRRATRTGCSARTRPTRRALFGPHRSRRTPRTASTTTSSTATPAVNPAGEGTQGRRAGTASRVAPGETVTVQLRLSRSADRRRRPTALTFDALIAAPEAEADAFYGTRRSRRPRREDQAPGPAPGASPA